MSLKRIILNGLEFRLDIKRVMYLKYLKTFLVYLLVFFCILGCEQIKNQNKSTRPTDEEILVFLDEFDYIFISTIKPCFEYLGEQVGIFIEKERDYESIVTYFKDNDFSELIPELEAISDKMPPFSEQEPETYNIARRYMSESTEFLKILVEIGNKYTGKKVQDITLEEKMQIDGLTLYNNTNK